MIALVGLSALVAIVNRRAAILSERAKEQAERQLAVFDTLRSFTYDFADKLRKVPGSDDLVIELLSQNVRTLEQISRLSGESQASARERASNLLKLGDQYLLHGNPRLARDAFENSSLRSARRAETRIGTGSPRRFGAFPPHKTSRGVG